MTRTTCLALLALLAASGCATTPAETTADNAPAPCVRNQDVTGSNLWKKVACKSTITEAERDEERRRGEAIREDQNRRMQNRAMTPG